RLLASASLPTRRSSDLPRAMTRIAAWVVLGVAISIRLTINQPVKHDFGPAQRKTLNLAAKRPDFSVGQTAIEATASQQRLKGVQDRKSTRLNSSHVKIS